MSQVELNLRDYFDERVQVAPELARFDLLGCGAVTLLCCGLRWRTVGPIWP
ncbi:MAG: hypothetical protein ACR2JX_10130 [Mycobacteriales bacterium]